MEQLIELIAAVSAKRQLITVSVAFVEQPLITVAIQEEKPPVIWVQVWGALKERSKSSVYFRVYLLLLLFQFGRMN